MDHLMYQDLLKNKEKILFELQFTKIKFNKKILKFELPLIYDFSSF